MATYIGKLAAELDLWLVDAEEPLELVLNARDIKGGIVQNPEKCAFARACRRQDEEKVVAVHVFLNTARVQYEDRLVRYHLPISVQKEIVSFDRGGKMAPGTYRLSPPCPSARLGSHSAGGNGQRKGRASAPRHFTTDVRRIGRS